MTSQVVGSDYTEGALLPNYVNGRLLVAEDLATGQRSLRTRDSRVGETAGAGIVRGLWVTSTSSTLTIAPGLGMSHAGEPVVVPRSVTLQLTFTTTGVPRNDADFGCCGDAPVDGTGTGLTSGVLLLVARPACRLEGQAPMMPPPGSQLSSCCAAQWQVEGVELRAIALPVGNTVGGVQVSGSNRRNLVTHWVLGTERLLQLGANPFGFDPAYTGLDQLDAADLTAYDVPLAVFRWDGSEVSDLDNWAARRRVTDPDPVTSSWSVCVSDRREADGQARFLQFQDQAEELVSRSVAGSATAPDHFGFLPPVGFLPVSNSHFRDFAKANVRRLGRDVGPEPMTVDEAMTSAAAEWTRRFTGGSDLPSAEDVQAAAANRASPRPDAENLALFQGLLKLAGSSVGYGYDPERFFGRLGRPGGVIDWQVAEWALNQSWKAMPVPTAHDAGEADVTPRPRLLAANPQLSDVAAVAERNSLFTYYYVIENLEAATASSLHWQLLGRRRRLDVGYIRSNLYVVFVANRRWVRGADAPVIPYAPGKGLFVDG